MDKDTEDRLRQINADRASLAVNPPKVALDEQESRSLDEIYAGNREALRQIRLEQMAQDRRH